VLLSTDGGLRGLGLLLNLLREFELEPILRDGGTLHRAIPVCWHRSICAGSSASSVARIRRRSLFWRARPAYLRELLLRLGVPTIRADATVVHPSVIAAHGAECVHTYESLAAKILLAARGVPLRQESDRRRLEGDGGWAWLCRYGFDGLSLGDLDHA
jgi:hypothetical protein